MNKKCAGCGHVLQTIDQTKEGYIPESKYQDSLYCQRCFKTIHYNKSTNVLKNVDINSFIKKINNSKSAMLYVIDLLTMSEITLSIINKVKVPLYVVLTKKDLLPKSVKDSKLINYIKEYYNVKNVFIVSSKKKYNIDYLYNTLDKDKIKNIYVCGYSNAGKSALIKSLIESTGKKSLITVSSSLNTTLEEMTFPLDEHISLIDTPGFTNENSISNYIEMDEYTKLLPKKEIKPKIYVLKPNFVILFKHIRIENNSNTSVRLSFYIGEKVKIEKFKTEKRNNYKSYKKVEYNLSSNEDLVIEGLGFIKIIDNCKLDIYAVDERIISKRRKLV